MVAGHRLDGIEAIDMARFHREHLRRGLDPGTGNLLDMEPAEVIDRVNY
jgi:hypothetical protein